MKTNVKFSRGNCLKSVYLVPAVLLLLAQSANGQTDKNIRTLLRPDAKISQMWVPEIKVNSIQGIIGTLVGFYGGALIDDKFLIGITGGVNLTHPKVNYGYFGGIAQAIFYSEKMVHFSGQVIIAWGTTKDYENPKKGLLDNFWNISGEDFSITEPGLNVEINVKKNLTLVFGISYRFASKLDSSSEEVRFTKVTDKNMSGLNFNIGLKFGKNSKSSLSN
jgi:hypothetical protein